MAAWPNAFTLFNNLAAGTIFPTYLLRGLDLSRVDTQLGEQVDVILGNVGSPLAVNLYLTLPASSLPLLEPLHLAGDAVSLMTAGMLPNNPFTMLGNALAPALTSLVNLGYTDVVRNPDGSYTRTLTGASTPTPFFSFPKVNWGQVIPDVINQLVKGFQKEFFSGNPTAPPPNAITGLLNLVRDLLSGNALGNVLPFTGAQATELPSANRTMLAVSTDPDAEAAKGKHAALDGSTPDDAGLQAHGSADELGEETQNLSQDQNIEEGQDLDQDQGGTEVDATTPVENPGGPEPLTNAGTTGPDKDKGPEYGTTTTGTTTGTTGTITGATGTTTTTTTTGTTPTGTTTGTTGTATTGTGTGTGTGSGSGTGSGAGGATGADKAA